MVHQLLYKTFNTHTLMYNQSYLSLTHTLQGTMVASGDNETSKTDGGNITLLISVRLYVLYWIITCLHPKIPLHKYDLTYPTDLRAWRGEGELCKTVPFPWSWSFCTTSGGREGNRYGNPTPTSKLQALELKRSLLEDSSTSHHLSHTFYCFNMLLDVSSDKVNTGTLRCFFRNFDYHIK